jgi:16S rRNA (cytosine967-C5)-methyltransferase
MTARDVARMVLERVSKDQAWATLALDAALTSSGLDERDRRFASELSYGVLRHQSRLDSALSKHAQLNKTQDRVLIALRLAAYQLLMLDRVPAYAVIDDAVSTSKRLGGDRVGGFVNAVLRKVASDGFPALPDKRRFRQAAEYSMPLWIVDQIDRAVEPHDFDAAVAALCAQPPLTLRANRRRISADALQSALCSEGVDAALVPGCADAVVVDGIGDPSRHPRFVAGEFAVQDVGAQRVAQLAAPMMGQRILDACAGVGGKSCHLAELQHDSGQIDAVDLSPTKLQLLAHTATRLGHSSIRTVQGDLCSPNAALANDYPLIVVDAPCSGLGVLRRHPDAKWRLTYESLAPLVALQATLLDALLPRVAGGGALIYSVCSFTNHEGPTQIAKALQRHSNFFLEHEERTWPHRDNCDAFYLAKLRRR